MKRLALEATLLFSAVIFQLFANFSASANENIAQEALEDHYYVVSPGSVRTIYASSEGFETVRFSCHRTGAKSQHRLGGCARFTLSAGQTKSFTFNHCAHLVCKP